MTLTKDTLNDGQLMLVPATRTMIEAELAHNTVKLCKLLGTSAPPYWPPELNDDDSFTHFLNILNTAPDSAEWGAHYAIANHNGYVLVGTGGFVKPPDENGIVEIGYSILTPYRQQGYATQLARLLVKKAFADQRITYVIAKTYPHLIGSIDVLTKVGFDFDGKQDDGTIAYKLGRS